MRKTAALLVIMCVVASRDSAAQSTAEKARPYRFAVGTPSEAIVHSGRPASNFGLSASMDLRKLSRFTLRGDMMVIDGASAVTADLTMNLPVWRVTAYPIVGAGVAAGVRAAVVGGGGADFGLRGRPLFAEFRAYRQPSVGAFRVGVRF